MLLICMLLIRKNMWNTRNGPAWRHRWFNHMNIPSIGVDSTSNQLHGSLKLICCCYSWRYFLLQFHSACQIQKSEVLLAIHFHKSWEEQHRGCIGPLKNGSLSVCNNKPAKSHQISPPLLGSHKRPGAKKRHPSLHPHPHRQCHELGFFVWKSANSPWYSPKSCNCQTQWPIAYPLTYPILDCTGFFRSTFGPGPLQGLPFETVLLLASQNKLKDGGNVYHGFHIHSMYIDNR